MLYLWNKSTRIEINKKSKRRNKVITPWNISYMFIYFINWMKLDENIFFKYTHTHRHTHKVITILWNKVYGSNPTRKTCKVLSKSNNLTNTTIANV